MPSTSTAEKGSKKKPAASTTGTLSQPVSYANSPSRFQSSEVENLDTEHGEEKLTEGNHAADFNDSESSDNEVIEVEDSDSERDQ